MARILVTGASGFVGSNLTRRLLKDGHSVSVLLRGDHAKWRLDGILGDVQPFFSDLRDAEGVSRAVKAVRPEWIFHLAAYGAYSSQRDLSTTLQTNVMGTANLLSACMKRGFDVFVNTGSSSEYGFKGHPPSETEFLEPNSHYAVAKASATLLCSYTARSHRVRIPTLRLYSVYGPFEEPTRLIPTLILDGFRNALPPLVNPTVARDFVYVDDVVDAYLLAASITDQRPDAIYNVGTGVQSTIREIVKVAVNTLKITAEPRWSSMADRSWDTDTWVCDSSSIRRQLSWAPRSTVKRGFEKTVEWFQDNPTVFRAYENETKTAPVAELHFCPGAVLQGWDSPSKNDR